MHLHQNWPLKPSLKNEKKNMGSRFPLFLLKEEIQRVNPNDRVYGRKALKLVQIKIGHTFPRHLRYWNFLTPSAWLKHLPDLWGGLEIHPRKVYLLVIKCPALHELSGSYESYEKWRPHNSDAALAHAASGASKKPGKTLVANGTTEICWTDVLHPKRLNVL